jgi:hypothetical protein
VLLARLLPSWKTALDRPAGHTHPLASRVVQGGVAPQIESQVQTSSSDTIHNDHPVDLAVGNRQPVVGYGTDPGVAETGHPGQQTHDPEVSETDATLTAQRTNLVHVRTRSRSGYLGV